MHPKAVCDQYLLEGQMLGLQGCIDLLLEFREDLCLSANGETEMQLGLICEMFY